MSAGPSTPPSDASPSPTHAVRAPSWLRLDEIVFLALLALSVGGVAVTDFSAQHSFRYWLVVAAVFAGTMAVSAAFGSQRERLGQPRMLLRLGLHWATFVGALYLIELIARTGRFDNESASLVNLLALSLVTVLAGLHFGWLFAVLGLALAVLVLVMAVLEQLLWLALIFAVAVGVAAVLWLRRHRSA